MNLRQSISICGVILLFTLSAFGGPPPLRIVRGSVLDAQSNPLPSAVVYLLNLRTHSVRTFIANKEGGYRFAGLSPNDDYEIYAKYKGLISSKATISHFDSQNEFTIDLKVDKPK